jgi:hypothetical protein
MLNVSIQRVVGTNDLTSGKLQDIGLLIKRLLSNFTVSMSSNTSAV